MAQVPLDKAYLTAIWLETLLYGVNSTLSWTCAYILWKKKSKTPWIMLAVVALQWMISTVHVSLGFMRLIYAFIYFRDKPGGPEGYLTNISIPSNVAKVFIHTLNSAVGDSIVVWRCYLVWGRSWRIVTVSLILLVGFIISGIGQTYHFATGQAIHSAFVRTLTIWNGLVFSFSLATNLTATSLIALRVWHVFRMISGVTRSLGAAKVLVLVIESGMIYSAALIIEISCYFSGSNAFYIIYDPIAQLTSIVPTMIILLVAFKQTSSDIKTRMTVPGKHSSGSTTLPTVNFRTNPDLVSVVTTDAHAKDLAAPKFSFVDPSDGTTSTESASSKRGSYKAEVLELETRTGADSEKNV